MLKAKFKCVSVTRRADDTETIGLMPVIGNNGENAQWSKFTPNGNLEMVISNPAAQGLIQPGREYFLDLREAEPTA